MAAEGAKTSMPDEVEPVHFGNAPFFFLSYARTPRQDPSDSTDPDRWVYKLYRDLCEIILHLTNTQRAGYMDREIRVGTDWPRDLATALATCRVFVPLYSPRYFTSEYCGKEWYSFVSRALNSAAIVPALWVSVDQDRMPDVAKTIQFNHHELGQRYGNEGFYAIMKVARYRHDYQLAVLRLAQRIVDVANRTQIRPDSPIDYSTVESAFGIGADQRMPGRQMKLTVVAPDRGSLPGGRKPDYYGATPCAWNPYHPATSQPIADYAAEIVRHLGYQATVGTFGDHISDGGDETRPSTPGLFLVDAWATRSPDHVAQLRSIDALGQPWNSVLVPWNRDDAQTTEAERDLRESLNRHLGRTIAEIPYRYQSAATGIPTRDELGRLLGPMTNLIFKKFVEHAPVYPPEGDNPQRPRLRGTDGQDSGGQS